MMLMSRFRGPASGFGFLIVFVLAIPACAVAGDVPQPQADAALFGEIPVVQAATLHAQTLEEAPASVTVISRREIREYGYRTLGEALSNVRGFYGSTDGAFTYVGVRGFSLLGDYNTRFLVMVNGHNLTDNVNNAMYMFGNDFGIEMDLVERIEIIRGPSSTLYGSNGLFAVINVITRSPVDHRRVEVRSDLGSFGERRLSVSTSQYLGGGANLLLAASGFYARGRTAADGGLGVAADRVGGEHGYRGFANLVWRNWSFTANFGDRTALMPYGAYAAVFGDPGTKSADTRNFVEATYSRDLAHGDQLRWSVSYDQFRYDARYDYEIDGTVSDTRDLATGDSLRTQLAYSRPVGWLGRLTVGGEASADLRNFQEGYIVTPEYRDLLGVSVRNLYQGLFAQDEIRLGPRWNLLLGARLDGANHFRSAFSPKLSLIFNPSKTAAIKFMYCRGFRNPSSYEMFYASELDYRANLDLRPEYMDTGEIAFETKVGRRSEFVVSGFLYRLRDLIEGQVLPDGFYQYHNASQTRAYGLESEFRTRLASGAELAAGYTHQRAYMPGASEALANSPRHLGYLRGLVPVAGRLHISGVARYMSARHTAYGYAVDGHLLADATATVARVLPGLDLQFGVRNAANRAYTDPLSPEHLTREVPGKGRSLFVRLLWHTGE